MSRALFLERSWGGIFLGGVLLGGGCSWGGSFLGGEKVLSQNGPLFPATSAFQPRRPMCTLSYLLFLVTDTLGKALD